MTYFKWCLPTLEQFNDCERWWCKCGHTRSYHYNDHEGKLGTRCSHKLPDERCSCLKFQYSNNDLCTIECAIMRKIYEIEM